MKSLSTAWLSIFLLSVLPIVAPTTPKIIMRTINVQLMSGMPVILVEMKDKLCEKKIASRELNAAVFVSMEKKKERIIRLMGPPPIPRKEEKIPRTEPAMKARTWFRISIFLMFSFFSV